MKKYIGLFNYFVYIEMQNEVLELFRFYLGDYYEFRDELDGEQIVIGTVKVCNDDLKYEERIEKYITSPQRHIIMKKGKYKDNRVVAIEYLGEKNRVFWIEKCKLFYEVDDEKKIINIVSNQEVLQKKEIVILIRNQILCAYFEMKGGIKFHSSIITNRKQEGIVFCGPSGAGKTTAYLCAVGSKKFLPHTSDKALISSRNGQLYAYCIPNQIRVLKGVFQATKKDFLKECTEINMEDKQEKITFNWRDLYDLYDVTDIEPVVKIKKIIQLRYDDSIEEIIDKKIEGTEKENIIDLNILTGKDLDEEPMWLGWYMPMNNNQVADQMSLTEVREIRWPSIEKLKEYIYYLED